MRLIVAGTRKKSLSVAIDVIVFPSKSILTSTPVDVSVQNSPILTSPKAIALGTILTSCIVVAHASFEASDSTPALTPLTVKQYSVAAVKPVTEKYVSVALPANSPLQ